MAKKISTYILRVRTFGVTRPRRPHLEGGNVVVTTVNLRSRDSSNDEVARHKKAAYHIIVGIEIPIPYKLPCVRTRRGS